MFKSLIYFFILGLLSTPHLFPQNHLYPSELKRLREITNFLSQNKNINTGISFIDSLIVSNREVPSLKLTFKYEGELIKSFEEYSYTFASPNSRVTNVYNENNRVSSRFIEFWSTTWVPGFRDSISYDSLGNEISVLTSNFIDGQWVNGTLFQTIYNGKIKIQTTSYWEDEKWESAYKDSFFYKDNGLLDSFILSIKENGTWTYDRKNLFFSNEKKQYDYVISNKWDGNNWQLLIKDIPTYDSYGNIIENLYYTPQDTTWQKYSRETYEINSQGYYSSELLEAYGNNMWFETDGILILHNPGSLDLAFLGFSRFNVYYNLTSIANETDNIIRDFNLSNYPNPFNPSTNITFSLKERGLVSLKVYDMLGREVTELLNEERERGMYKIPFNGENLSSGVYACILRVNKSSTSHKMLLIK